MAEKAEGKVKSLIEVVGHSIVVDIAFRYRTLCKLMGWRPRVKYIAELINKHAGDLELALRQLIDSNALHHNPGALPAHRYLVALATVMEALSYCGPGSELEWFCRAKDVLFRGLGEFLVYGSAEPIAGAICDAFPQLCTE